MRSVILRVSAVLAAAGTALFLPLLALGASADIVGPCSATLNGTNVAQNGGPIDVGSNDIVAVTMGSAAAEVTHLRVQMHYGPASWTVYNQDTSGRNVNKNVSVEDYARYGVGLYKVTSTATLSSGEGCSGSALVKVSGSPLTTVAGAAAAAGVGLGVAGLAVAAGLAYSKAPEPPSPYLDEEAARARAAQGDSIGPGKALRILTFAPCVSAVLPAILLTILAMVTGGGGAVPLPPGPARGARPRARWGIRLSAVGLLSGVLAGAGAVVLLQQYAVVYPSTGVIAAGLAAGLAVGILLPSLGRTLAIRRARRRRSEEPPAHGESKP